MFAARMAMDVVATQARWSPRNYPNLAAWYDASDLASMVIDGSNRVSLIADKSGNSEVNCWCNGNSTVTGQSMTAANKSVTGSFSIAIDFAMETYRPAANRTIIDKLSGNNGFQVLLLTTGVVRLRIGNGTSVADLDSSALINSPFGRTTLTIAWVDGTSAQFSYTRYDNYTDPFNEDLGSASAVVGTNLTNAAVSITLGQFVGRLYSVTVGGIYSCNTALAPKLATSFSSGGDTWTVNSSGDLGARISGERDLVQLTASKQPIYLAQDSAQYLYLNGVSGNYASSPDSAAVSITGDIDIRAQAALTNWKPSGVNWLVSKMLTDGQSSYDFGVTSGSTGILIFRYSAAGSYATIRSAQSSVAVPFSNFATGWVRVTYVSATGKVDFYTSTDGTTWSALGTQQTITAGSIFDGTDQLRIGGGSSSACDGKIYRAQIYNGIAGTLAFDANFNTWTSGTTLTESSSNAATVTINGGATVAGKTPALYLDGTDDYFGGAKWSLSQPETVYFAGQQVSNTVSDSLMDGGSNGTLRMSQTGTTSEVLINAGASLGNLTPGLNTNSVLTGVYNGASSSFRNNRGTALTGSAGTGIPNGYTLGAQPTPTNYANIQCKAVAIYSAAHATATQDDIIVGLGSQFGIAV